MAMETATAATRAKRAPELPRDKTAALVPVVVVVVAGVVVGAVVAAAGAVETSEGEVVSVVATESEPLLTLERGRAEKVVAGPAAGGRVLVEVAA